VIGDSSPPGQWTRLRVATANVQILRCSVRLHVHQWGCLFPVTAKAMIPVIPINIRFQKCSLLIDRGRLLLPGNRTH